MPDRLETAARPLARSPPSRPLVVALAVLAPAPPARRAARAAPCSVRTYPGPAGQAHDRTSTLTAEVQLVPADDRARTTTFRPKFNLYTFPLPQLVVVHNLEHGGIAIQYGRKVPKATVGEDQGLVPRRHERPARRAAARRSAARSP